MKARSLLALAAAVPLAACLSFGAKPPASLLTLTPTATLPADTARNATDGQAVVVITPSAPAPLSTLRVPVQASATEIAYLKDAQWTDTPAKMFRGLLAETIAARTSHVVLDVRQFSVSPGIRLSGGIKAFGLDHPSGSAVVIFDATLSRSGKDQLETRRFEAHVPVSDERAAPVGAALNQAANQVAVQVADWIGQ
ncbi:ABC-type transport auxiliary lipoprotein family protein [Flavisphingomonas formosensis]|uniref:ABC-type transport auxiliary lipoprotein family protein n=1 Tax=Flavisphingomonas formosensis TaxID=861534 RepID=UPI0012FB6ADB|nr:ABC-type transport auxiliary lipoprotein family protein [Sphingomonas formosensis]